MRYFLYCFILHCAGSDEMNRYDGTKDISKRSSKKLYEILDVENINVEANITIINGNFVSFHFWVLYLSLGNFDLFFKVILFLF